VRRVVVSGLNPVRFDAGESPVSPERFKPAPRLPSPIACAAFQWMVGVLRHVTGWAELFREVNGRHAERATAGTRCASVLSPEALPGNRTAAPRPCRS
jgi:hypothetical protein